MNALKTSVLLFICLLMVAAPCAKAQTADEIIGKHIEALGGKEKLQSIKSVYMEGVAVMGNGTEIDSKTWQVKDKLYRQEISFGMGNVVVIVTPTKGWRSDPRNGGAFAPIPDSMVKNMQTQLDPAGPLVAYAAKGSKVELLGKDTVGGKACYKLKLTYATGNYVTYFIDAQTYYVLRVARKGGGMMGGGGGGGRRDPNAEFNIDFGDYQKTPDGYIFPFTIVAGGFGAKSSVEKLEVNKPVDEEKLGKPGN
jgi:outer membrane lipoprotein-sorting protein